MKDRCLFLFFVALLFAGWFKPLYGKSKEENQTIDPNERVSVPWYIQVGAKQYVDMGIGVAAIYNMNLAMLNDNFILLQSANGIALTMSGSEHHYFTFMYFPRSGKLKSQLGTQYSWGAPGNSYSEFAFEGFIFDFQYQFNLSKSIKPFFLIGLPSITLFGNEQNSITSDSAVYLGYGIVFNIGKIASFYVRQILFEGEFSNATYNGTKMGLDTPVKFQYRDVSLGATLNFTPPRLFQTVFFGRE